MAKTDGDKPLPRACILEEGKICDNCCECFVCDLDPGKLCDNCARCLGTADYSGIIIDEIITDGLPAERVVKRLVRKRPANGSFRLIRRP
jgi:hypothetical protein